ncbi:MAG: hypothetical protein ACLRNQ_25725 [Flavonifractor plautii]
MPGRGDHPDHHCAGEYRRGHRPYSGGETALEYDGMRVETGPLDDSGMSPVDAVPVLMDYVQEGFIAECGMEAQGESEVSRVVCREPESAAGEGRECSLWFDPSTHALLRGSCLRTALP